MSISGVTPKGYPAERLFTVNTAVLWRLMRPGPDPRRRLIFAHPERSFGGLDLVANAPAGDKRAGERGITEVDRDRIVQHPARPRRRHRPAVRAAVLVEPGGHSSVLSAETFRRDGDADADWEAPFGPCDQRARIARHRSSFVLTYDHTIASPCPAAWRPQSGAAMLAPCVAAPVCPPTSARSNS